MMTNAIHRNSQWPLFTWDISALAAPYAEIRFMQGRLLGQMESLVTELQQEAFLRTLSFDVLAASSSAQKETEGETIPPFLQHRLTGSRKKTPALDLPTEGAAELLLDASQNYTQPITKKRILAWHAALFPKGKNGTQTVRSGQWRSNNTGPALKAPSAFTIDRETELFFTWFNDEKATDFVLRAAVAHLWFMAIRPFEDGNSRIASALSDMMLARAEKSNYRFYSLSRQIRDNKASYDEILDRSLNGSMDITGWIAWFLLAMSCAFETTRSDQEEIFRKARFWEMMARTPINERQRAMIELLLDGKEHKLTTSKWARRTKCSQDTALRDIQNLMEIGILNKTQAGGRSTQYVLIAA